MNKLGGYKLVLILFLDFFFLVMLGVVVVGFDIYVVGGSIDGVFLFSVFVMDIYYYIWCKVLSMYVFRVFFFVSVFDGKYM